MAVTFVLGVCMPTEGWGVFRFSGGSWRLVLRRSGYNAYAPLSALGTDIGRRRAGLRGPVTGLFPSGGTHARIWHWNGSLSWPVRGRSLRGCIWTTSSRQTERYWCRIVKDATENDAWCGKGKGRSSWPP